MLSCTSAHTCLPATPHPLQDTEALLDARLAPGSCRSGTTVHALSSNGTLVPVKASITHHPGSLGQGAAWAVTFTRSSEAALADERCLELRVKFDGTIVGASRGTPQQLFGWDPARLVGQQLDVAVDVFREYTKGGERGWVKDGFTREEWQPGADATSNNFNYGAGHGTSVRGH